MTDYIHAIVQFAEAHANWVYALAFAATFLESVAVIGLLVPGSGIIVALGTLIPSGAVGFWWLCLWAVLGALGGDGLSYWIGHHYGDRLRELWPFNRHREVLAHGERFFAKHGGKSVFLSRFVAPVRGAVPLVAGLARMEPSRFLVANATSALGWAPAHIIPGILIGAGLTLTNAVATRLLVFAILLGVLMWLIAKIAVLAVRSGPPLLEAAQRRVDAWARRRRDWFARRILALIDPAHGEARSLAMLGLVVVGGAWLFFGIIEDVLTGDPLVRADAAIYNLLQGLRSLPADHLMVAITELGGRTVIGAVAAAVLLWLTWRRAWHTMAYWIAAFGGAGLIGLAIKVTLHRPRPAPIYTGWDAFSFPSGHATTSAAVYGFLAVLLARGLAPVWQALIGVSAVLMVVLIGFSRIYLGAHWFSDVIGGVVFGATWVALLSIAYVRHDPPRLPTGPFAAIVIATLVGVGGMQIVQEMPADLQRYSVREPVRSIAAEDWWGDAWRDIPVRRVDLAGEREEPLVLQWAGSLADLRRLLTGDGWQPPPEWSLQSALGFFAPVQDPMAPPVLPRLHDGRSSALTLIHAVDGGREASRWVLRVWKAGVRLDGPSEQTEPLWLGAITLQHFKDVLAPVSLAFEKSPKTVPWSLLTDALPAMSYVMRTDPVSNLQIMLAHDPTEQDGERGMNSGLKATGSTPQESIR